MTEHRESDAGRRLARDLEAFRAMTARDLPDLDDTARALAGPRPRDTREDWFMRSIRFLRARPWITTAAATAALAAVLLLVPMSYERTTGHDVTMALSGNLDRGSLEKIAGEMKKALGADGVRVTRLGDAGSPKTELAVTTPSRSRSEVEAKAAAFARELGLRGMNAEARVTPRREKVSTTLYAMAVDRVIELRIERAGRTPDQIAADIRAQLEAAGIQNPTVQVSQNGDQTQIQIQANDQGSDGEGPREFRVNVKGDGTQPLDAQLHRFEVHRTPGMSDAEVKADIARQMREAGVEGTVTVQNGEVRIEAKKRE